MTFYKRIFWPQLKYMCTSALFNIISSVTFYCTCIFNEFIFILAIYNLTKSNKYIISIVI